MAIPEDLDDHLDQIECGLLIEALKQNRYNRTRAGMAMGLSLRQMRYRMARHGIEISAINETASTDRKLSPTDREVSPSNRKLSSDSHDVGKEVGFQPSKAWHRTGI